MFLRWKLELLLLNHSKAKKSHLLQKEEKDISAIERELDQQHLSEVALEVKRQEMEEIIRYKTAGAILRSKIRW